MQRRVIFHPDAKRELVELYEYIAEHGGAARAGKFVREIRDYCGGFSTFPERGVRRDDVGRGVRVVGFRKRVSIVFAIDEGAVNILGIYYGGRSFDSSGWEDDGTS